MQLSAIIIAGGKSRRMGIDKKKMIYRNQTLLQKTVALAEYFTHDIIISSNNPNELFYRTIADEIDDIGPLGGLFSCLKYAQQQHILVLPVDMPLLDKQIIQYLLNQADKQKMINVYNVNNRLQMLVGIYNKGILPLIEKQIELKDYKLRNLLQKSAYHLIDGSNFADKFININTPEQWAALQKNNG